VTAAPDPLATTFDSLVGALAAASGALGRPIDADAALVATGRAFRLAIDDHLRVVPPGAPEVDEALQGLGLVGEATSRLDAIAAHEGPLLLWGTGGNAYGLALRREDGALVLRSPLAASELRVPQDRLEGGKVAAVLVRGLRDPAPVERARVAREELARPSVYLAWARVLATHPLSRLDPEGFAWTLARVAEARRAAASALPDPGIDAERRLLGELRVLFPLPDAGSLGAGRIDHGAALLAGAARVHEAWLTRAAAG
jgi:hypothetical protein